MSREDAAAKAMVDSSVKWQTTDAGELAKVALEAADADDAANKMVRASWDDLRAVRDEAWNRGYEACREGKQKHSPYRTS